MMLDVSPAEYERAREAGKEVSEPLHLSELVEPYSDRAWVGAGETRPTLYLDDVSELPFLDGILGVEEYQHRARVRANDRDLFAAVTSPAPGYEVYCRQRLALGSPDALVAEPVAGPIAVTQACLRAEAFRGIARRTRANGIVIHPYMSIEPVWRLAKRLKEKTGHDVRVLGPPPPLTEFANDKAHFRELVARVLGDDWNVDTRTARHPEVMAEHLLGLSELHPLVALKRTRCTSGMGNHVFESKRLRARARPEIEEDVRAFLERTHWDGRQEVLIVSWEQTVCLLFIHPGAPNLISLRSVGTIPA